MSARIILFKGFYDVDMCRANPDITFVFGDNTLGFGKGGQAIIRDESNAIGIPTKRKPAMTAGSFFSAGNEDDIDEVLEAIGTIWDLLKTTDQFLLVPVTDELKPSLGLERAELVQRAPDIYDLICYHIDEMKNAYGYEVHTRETI